MGSAVARILVIAGMCGAATVSSDTASLSLGHTADVTPQFKPLFNGRDLEGWVIEHGPAEAWQVKEGILESSAPPKCWLRSRREYLNYVLRLEWRLASEGANSGVFLCARDIGEEFPSALEIQIYEGADAGMMFPIRKAIGGPTASVWEETARPPGEWNRYEVVVYNGFVLLSMNGKIVNQSNIIDPAVGHIGLQCETGKVQFRNIEIKEIVPPLADVRWSRGRQSGERGPGEH